MYREMTPEEKLDFISELTEATKLGGLLASIDIVEKWKQKLSTEKLETNKNKEIVPEPIDNNTNVKKIMIPVEQTSIYAQEHISAVQDDLMSQEPIALTEKNPLETPKTKVLKNATQSLWSDSSIRLPGEPIE